MIMKKNKYVTKLNLYIRILVAGYVVYLAYQLLPSIQGATGTEKISPLASNSARFPVGERP